MNGAERHCFADGKRADLLDATHLPCDSHGRFFFFHSYVSNALASPILPVNNLWIFTHMPSSKHPETPQSAQKMGDTLGCA